MAVASGIGSGSRPSPPRQPLRAACLVEYAPPPRARCQLKNGHVIAAVPQRCLIAADAKPLLEIMAAAANYKVVETRRLTGLHDDGSPAKNRVQFGQGKIHRVSLSLRSLMGDGLPHRLLVAASGRSQPSKMTTDHLEKVAADNVAHGSGGGGGDAAAHAERPLASLRGRSISRARLPGLPSTSTWAATDVESEAQKVAQTLQGNVEQHLKASRRRRLEHRRRNNIPLIQRLIKLLLVAFAQVV